MSNEYKDWSNDIQATLSNTTHELKLLPDGWVDTFVPELIKELAHVLGSYVEDFEVLQVKEKYGMLIFYWNWKDRDYTENEQYDLREMTIEIDDIIKRYEKISSLTCVVCGKR
ncbi:MAG: hypothetical protein IKT25_04610, partial [Firmicutes bacterium]|nr:hypothetical protein [Bacillota bacterium]